MSAATIVVALFHALIATVFYQITLFIDKSSAMLVIVCYLSLTLLQVLNSYYKVLEQLINNRKNFLEEFDKSFNEEK